MPVPSNRFVVLLRLSTQKLGADGLGIAVQKRDLEIFLQQNCLMPAKLPALGPRKRGKISTSKIKLNKL